MAGFADLQGYAAAPSSPWADYAWALLVLAVIIAIGLFKNRRASIAVGVLILALVLAHIFRIESPGEDYFARLFGFIASRYTPGAIEGLVPGGLPAALWSPFTYTFLHGNGLHLFSNSLALFVFGRSVAWRIGSWRFLVFFAACGTAGAFFYFIFNRGSSMPLIGASASVFGVMAATFRFVPRTQDRLRALFWPEEQVRNVRLASPVEILLERRSLTYILICLLIYPLGLIALIVGTSGNVAVTAHVGGFAFGLLGFGLFDRQRPEVSPGVAAGAPGEAKQVESLGLQLLRGVFVVLMIVGIIGGLFYYLSPFLLR